MIAFCLNTDFANHQSLPQQREFIAEIAESYSFDRRSSLKKIKNELIPVISNWKGGTILELGCAGGAVLSALRELDIKCVGVEIVKEMIDEIPAELRSSVIQADGVLLPFADNTFEMTILWGNTLGPIPGRKNRVALLEEARRVSVDGLLFVSVLNKHASIKRLTSKTEYIFKYKSKEDGRKSVMSGFNRFYTMKTLTSELNEAGYWKLSRLSGRGDLALVVKAYSHVK